jgi:hypothetical protein
MSVSILTSKMPTAEEIVERILNNLYQEDANHALSNLLHGLWTKAVGTDNYVKDEWRAMDILLHRLVREHYERKSVLGSS